MDHYLLYVNQFTSQILVEMSPRPCVKNDQASFLFSDSLFRKQAMMLTVPIRDVLDEISEWFVRSDNYSSLVN